MLLKSIGYEVYTLNFLKRQQGISLIELIVGTALMMIILAAVSPLVSMLTKTGTKGMSTNDLMEESRWAMSVMTQDISGSVPPGEGVGGLPTYSPSLTLYRWDTGWSGNSGYPIVYSLVTTNNNPNTSQLCRSVNGGTAYPLTDSNRAIATGLNFTTSPLGDNVTISLTLTNPNSPYQSETISSTVFLLNFAAK